MAKYFLTFFVDPVCTIALRAFIYEMEKILFERKINFLDLFSTAIKCYYNMHCSGVTDNHSRLKLNYCTIEKAVTEFNHTMCYTISHLILKAITLQNSTLQH